MYARIFFDNIVEPKIILTILKTTCEFFPEEDNNALIKWAGPPNIATFNIHRGLSS